MAEEETTQAAAYIKLHEDVKDLILTTVMNELQLNYQGPFSSYLRNSVLMSVEAEIKIKGVIRDQWNRH